MVTFRDPIHGDIILSDWAARIIDTPAFQRLRRIKQLGGASMVFSGATHNRFQHSVGVYHILAKIRERVEGADKISDSEWTEVLAAGLLHDIGHGPLSHALEVITNNAIDHEKNSQLIIMGQTQVNKVLIDSGIDPENVAALISGTHNNKGLVSLISSNIDADRMDYLRRDAYYTGTTYGNFDMDRIIKSMIITKEGVIFRESGLAAIEHFLIARFQSFNQVYHHRVSVSYEELYKLIFKRVVDIDFDHPETRQVKKMIAGELSLSEFLELDDDAFFSYISKLAKTPDEILQDLCNRVRNRDLFRATNYSEELEKKVRQQLVLLGKNPRYYMSKTELKASAYKAAEEDYKNVSIKIRDSGEIVKLNDKSTLIGPMVDNSTIVELLIFPKYCEI